MLTRFPHWELECNRGVPSFGDDAQLSPFHNRGMAKVTPKPRPEWFLAEWLDYLNLKQADLIEPTGRSKGRISELVSGARRFNQDDLRAVSDAIGITRGFIIEVNPLSPEGAKVADRGRLPPPPIPQGQQSKKRA